MGKAMRNSTASGARVNVPDTGFWGDGDMFRLLSKAYSQSEDWMKSTKAMEIPGVGCVVQVTTQQGDNVAEAVCFVPGVCIKTVLADPGDPNSETIERRLVKED